MLNLNADDFIKCLYAAQEWSIVTDTSSGRLIMTTRNRIPDSGVIHEEQFLGPDVVDMSHAEFIVFRAALEDVRALGTGPRRLIGYKIGEKLYHPDDVELVYDSPHAESKPDAPSGESGEAAEERQHFEGWRRVWQDENSDGVLRNPGSVD